MKIFKTFLILTAVGLIIMIGYLVIRNLFRPARYFTLVEWLRNSEDHPDWAISARERCDDAPFAMPTDGLVGFIWGDSFRIGHTHQGIDIFGGKEAGITPVYSAYDGYLTRLDAWKSSLIIRIPDDPFNSGQQIWTYYTHLADEAGASFIAEDFPPGTTEMFVEAGTFLGYQGNYSGTPNHPTGVHLHFSIVKDDGNGKFLNELEIKNTLDPSPYFGLPLNSKSNSDTIPVCGAIDTP